MKKRFPKSLRKYIRREKSKIRKESLGDEEKRKKIKEFLDKLTADVSSKDKKKKPKKIKKESNKAK